MSISEALIQEMTHEAANTRKMLEAVPDDKLGWQPHEKSMSLGKLVSHLAENPAWGAFMTGEDLDFAADPDTFKPFEAKNNAELLECFDKGVASYKEALADRDDEFMMQPWTMKNGDHVFFTLPRAAAFRTWTLSHMVHHRGQLSVYLRMLDVPVPGTYGPSADTDSGEGY